MQPKSTILVLLPGAFLMTAAQKTSTTFNEFDRQASLFTRDRLLILNPLLTGTISKAQ